MVTFSGGPKGDSCCSSCESTLAFVDSRLTLAPRNLLPETPGGASEVLAGRCDRMTAVAPPTEAATSLLMHRSPSLKLLLLCDHK